MDLQVFTVDRNGILVINVQVLIYPFKVKAYIENDTACLAFWVNGLGCSWMEGPVMCEFCLRLKQYVLAPMPV